MAGNQIAVFTRSQYWNSVLKRWYESTPIQWILDFEGWTSEPICDPPKVAIIELAEETIEADSMAVFERRSQGWETKFFAVADAETAFWLPLIQSCGFLHLATVNSGHNRLRSIVDTYMNSLSSPTIEIEKRVARDLPWTPVRGNAAVDGKR